MGLEDLERFRRLVDRADDLRARLKKTSRELWKSPGNYVEFEIRKSVFDDIESFLEELGKKPDRPLFEHVYLKALRDVGKDLNPEYGLISHELRDDGYYVLKGDPSFVSRMLKHLAGIVEDNIPLAVDEYGQRARSELAAYLQKRGIPVREEHLANYDPKTLYRMYLRITKELPPWYLKYLAEHNVSPSDALYHILHFSPKNSEVLRALERDPALRRVVAPSVLLELSSMSSKSVRHFFDRVRALKGVSPDLVRRAVESVGSEGYVRLVRFSDIDDLRRVFSHPDPRVQSQLFRILLDHQSLDNYAKHLSYSRIGPVDPRRVKAVLRLLSRGGDAYVRDLAERVASGDSAVVASTLIQLRSRRPDLWKFLSRAISGDLRLPKDVSKEISSIVLSGLDKSAELSSPSPILQSGYRARDLSSMLRYVPAPAPPRREKIDPEWRRVARLVEKELKKRKVPVDKNELLSRIMEVSGYDLSWARDPRNRPYLVNAFVRGVHSSTRSSKSVISIENEQYYTMGALAAIRALAENLGNRASVWRDRTGRLVIDVRAPDHERKLIFKLPQHLSMFASGPIMYTLSDDAVMIDPRSVKHVISAMREVERRLDKKNRAYVRRVRKLIEGFAS